MVPGELLLKGFDVFLLVFVRMTGLFVVAPIFGRRNIPVYFKIGFSFFTALILVNTMAAGEARYDDNLLLYAVLAAKEFLVGLVSGFVAYITYTAIYIAGEIIDMQIGFGVVNVMDPLSSIQVPVTSNIYFIISMLVFFAVKGHHMLIRALFDSCLSLPPGAATFGRDAAGNVMELFGEVFATGFKIAAPIAGTVLITDVALGTISRMVPQMNIFVIGMPVKILVGLIIMAITVPAFVLVMESVFGMMESGVYDYIKEIGPG